MTSRVPARFRRSLVSNYLSTGASVLVALLITPVLARGLGPRDYGVWILVSSIVSYLELVEFGFAATTIKYVAEYRARNELDRMRRAIATSFWVLSAPGALALFLGVLLALLWPLLFDVPSATASAARTLVLMQAVGLALSIPSDTFGGVLNAFQRFDLLNATLVAVLVLQAVAWWLVLESGGGLVGLGLAAEVFSLGGQLARYLLARKLIPDLSLSRRLFDRAMVKPFAGLSVWFAMRDVARIVIFRLDATVVGLVVGVPEAGVYAIGQKLALMAERLTFATMTMFFPHAAALAAAGDREGLRATVFTGTKISLAVAGPLAITLTVLARPAIDAWVGPSFQAAAAVVGVLAMTTAVRSITQTGVTALNGMGKARTPALVFTGEAILNLTLSVVLGSSMGIRGVAIATLIAGVGTHLLVLLPYTCRELGIPLVRFLRFVVRSHGPAALAGLVVSAALQRAGLRGLVPVGAAGVATVGAYLGVLVLTGLDEAERGAVRGALRRPARSNQG